MERSIAQAGRPNVAPGSTASSEAPLSDRAAAAPSRLATAGIGAFLALLALAVYVVSDPDRLNQYAHFVWQASAWLEGQFTIRYPVAGLNGQPGNDYYQDVMPTLTAAGQATGRALIPFPPLPAIVLLPFVAIFGLTTNAQLIATILGAVDVLAAYWMLGRLPLRPSVRVIATVFLAFGTVLWYAAELGTTWFLAHVVAVGLTIVAIGIALGGDARASVEPALPQLGWAGESGRGGNGTGGPAPAPAPAAARSDPERPARRRAILDARQVLAGFLFGLACTSRLTVAFGAPFFVLVGSGGSWFRRGTSAAVGMAIPLLALAAYNLASSGHLFNPAYDYLYQAEAAGYPELNYHSSWNIEDLRYLPQNLAITFLRLPELMPACDTVGGGRGIFAVDCPLARPDGVGMSLILTSPGYLLTVPAVLLPIFRNRLDRVTAGAAIAVVAIAFANLLHFSQGWVQFGYRFSNDFAPFALLLVALGIQRVHLPRGTVVGLVAISIAINLWGVVWGGLLGW